jgi:hypothetical protein
MAYIGADKRSTSDMKSITRNITAAAAAIITLIGATTQTHAAKLTLDGYGYYEFGHKIRHSKAGVSQTGRYSNLTGAYYRRAEIGMDWITSHSTSRSGKLSFELWGMSYYGATKGIVVMTRSLDSISGGNYRKNVSRNGNAVFLEEYRFPEVNLWEKTKSGWKFKDALSFKQNNLF